MTPREFLAEAERRLAAAGYAMEPLTLRGVPAVAGRRKTFRVRWFFTQLKTTVVVCATEGVSAQGWYDFVRDAYGLARLFQGGLPTGFQSGVGAVPVLAATHVDPYAAQAAAEKPRVQWFEGMALPALVDLATGQVHTHRGTQYVGAIYVPYLRKQRDLVTSIVATH
ncbi:MAG TPA: hypothetical protein VNA20_17365 [Frankiaceae bacterium]|nr:hypothetical protein [Frankiaceae bacterium]